MPRCKAKLVVRNVEIDVVRALNTAATTHGRSAEVEHREILHSALMRRRRWPLAEVLSDVPNVGMDEDFARSTD